MIRPKTRNIFTAGLCCLIFCLLIPAYGGSEENSTEINKKERAKINYVLKIETEKEIRTLFSQPVALLTEKILKDIEKEKNIDIGQQVAQTEARFDHG